MLELILYERQTLQTLDFFMVKIMLLYYQHFLYIINSKDQRALSEGGNNFSRLRL